MKYALGIDLGTTTSVVSTYRRGKVETLLIEGSKVFPSVVAFKDKDTILVGQSAKKRLILDPEHSIGSVKRFMGNSKKKYEIFGKTYDPVTVSSIILKRITEEAQKVLGEKVTDVIITVPAYFTDSQKEDTKKAGQKAGLNVIRLIPEPTAAAISYGLDKGKDQTIMVYDLGGGTFDVSILKIVGNKFEVIAVDGDSQLGGDDFDNAIADYLMDIFQKKTGINLKGDISKEAKIVQQRLKEVAEKAKVELSQAKSTEIFIPEIMGHKIEEELTLKQYNELIAPLLQRTVDKIGSVLKEAGLTARDIDRVILVGGSTRNTAVKEIVTREIKEPFISEQVDEEVSHGAAIMAASLTLPEEDFTPVEVQNRTAHSLGIEILDENSQFCFCPLIKRNSEYPIRQGLLVLTAQPFQSRVEASVFRGESHDCKNNTKLGELSLKISQLSKDQVPIGAIFELDLDGIMHFTCVELSINMGDTEVIQIVQEALQNKGMLNIEKIQRLIEKKRLKYERVQITVNN